MKIRSDYVSNSSSSSFVIGENEIKEAFKMLEEDFILPEYVMMNDLFGHTMDIYITLKNGECVNLDNALEDKSVTLDEMKTMEFMVDDYDKLGMASLWLFYKYFKKMGFHPDDSDSERPCTQCESFFTKMVDRMLSIQTPTICSAKSENQDNSSII